MASRAQVQKMSLSGGWDLAAPGLPVALGTTSDDVAS
jgi:hypothetical protein